MKEFAENYDIHHVTSSPYYPQSNGQAERAVRTVKQLMRDAPDPHKALLSYRATPLPSCGLSPAELLMGRKNRTDVPQLQKLLIPEWPYLKGFREKDGQYKEKQKHNYDQRHHVQPLPPLPNDTLVWVDTPTGQTPGRIVAPSGEPRSYNVKVPSGKIRRNQAQLRPRLGTEQPINPPAPRTPKVIATRSRTGSAPGP